MSASPGRPPRPLRPGATIAPGLRVVEHLRRGEDTDVYDAFSAERGSRCVAKTLRPDRAGVTAARRNLVAEARLLLRLTHPGIVRAYELVPGDAPVLVLETLGGATLAHILDTTPRLRAHDVAELGLQLASALGYLHRGGVVHLDVKPSNVIAEAGRARLIDLGIARRPGRVPRGLGTPGHMPPEQADGAAAGPWSDVWGLGALLYLAATGERPHPRAPRPVRTLRRLPSGMGAAIDACLATDPRGRCGLGDLEAALRTVTGARLP